MGRKWMVLLLVVGLLLVGGSFILTILESTNYFYEGKEVFQTTQEYGAFKEAIGVPEVDIWEMLVLSSEPPIVVDYQIEASRSLDFPYGEKSILPSGILFAFVFGLGLIGAIVGGLLLVFADTRNTVSET